MEIIPSINVESFEELKRKVALVEHLVSWVHLDISDGTFSKTVTWHNPDDLKLLKTNLNIEVHLMVSEVEKKISDWLIPEIKRIFFHLPAVGRSDLVINKCREAGIEPAIAFAPDEPLKLVEKVKTYQILGVEPGPAGQKTSPDIFEKIKKMREICPRCIIEADGGMNKETAKKAREAGADIIVAATAIYGTSH